VSDRCERLAKVVAMLKTLVSGFSSSPPVQSTACELRELSFCVLRFRFI
jgi:hypothetical protein